MKIRDPQFSLSRAFAFIALFVALFDQCSPVYAQYVPKRTQISVQVRCCLANIRIAGLFHQDPGSGKHQQCLVSITPTLCLFADLPSKGRSTLVRQKSLVVGSEIP